MLNQNPKSAEITINKSNLDKLVLVDYRRSIRAGAAGKLHGYLIKDGVFKAPIHVNIMNGVYRVVDGSHRVDALGRFIKGGKGREVKLRMCTYIDLTIEEEKELYDILAKTVTQSLNDFIKIHFDEVPVFQMIDNNFPVLASIYSTTDRLSFANLLKVWFCKESTSVESYSKETFLEKAKSLSRDDYVRMVHFFNKYKRIFGDPATTSPYYKFGVLWIILSIYYRNINVVDEENLWNIMRKKMFGNLLIIECSKARSRESTEDTRRILVEKLNHGWRGNRLV